jgi:hypothetical protein
LLADPNGERILALDVLFQFYGQRR